ncbi:fimbrial assembly protein [Bacillus sp. FJAT-29790]|uniref:fimbrial assembly protein n=1 Tax=Bacillus sp. FJAT-29790 TaxID=1895002 RepID=UPI001C211D7D|nr:fimbrial assembly protein [Bacillus sp. FJAT-29790]MBU8879563.1 fimbrial assembly protein [Bacillus sp. FJAT-29790]
MLADINLLPQKERKSKTAYMIIGIIILLIILISLFFFLFIKDKNQQLLNIENQIMQTNVILEAERKKQASFESSNSVNELEIAVKWAQDQPFNMVYVLQELTKLLPKRGFVAEFEIDEENKIVQIVQFDTKSEAAYYLNSLLTLDWIEEAVINEAKITDILKEEKDKEAKKDDILPRYFAKYELKMNVPLLKTSYQQQKEKDKPEQSIGDENSNQDEEEGGTSP